METRAPLALIGLFVLAAIGAVFGFVYWLNSTGGLGERLAVEVLDVRGARVRRLERQGESSGRIVWDGRDAAGRAVASGVYWLRIRDAERTRTIQVVKRD